MEEEEVHIAVGKNTKKEEANIQWAAAKFPRATIVFLHVHWPSEWMPFMGGEILYKFADEKEKEKHRDTEAMDMMDMFSKYKNQCGKRKVTAYYLTHRDIVAGVVSLVKNLKIKRIVIGSRKISKQDELRRCCQVWLVLRGKHISTSNDHMGNNGNTGYGSSSYILASRHERVHKCREGDTTPEKITEKSSTCQKEKFSKGKKAAKIMKKMDKLQKKLKELQGEVHSHEEYSLLPTQTGTSSNKCFAEPRYPELQIPEHSVQFSISQIRKATNNFHTKNMIGEGGYGPVYKGDLDGIPVAIKSLRPHGTQGFSEYQQEVMVLSKLEHPHIVRLIGVCHESCTLVYEHLPNGTLQDKLLSISNNNGLLPMPFPWEDRVRILVELRSALAYLHSHRPNAIIHADLKLANVLLDGGDGARLGDFGTARMVHVKPLEDEEETIVRRTNPMGTIGYMDPVFFTTGELTTESDVYAFGVVILQLLTGIVGGGGRINVVEHVRAAAAEKKKKKMMHGLLDVSAGDWPQVEAERLLKLALRCCSRERKQRPVMTCDSEWKSLLVLRDKAAPPPAKKSPRWNCFRC